MFPEPIINDRETARLIAELHDLAARPTDAKAGCLYPNNGRALRDARSRGFDNALTFTARLAA